jgi:hypothetical protein
MKRRVRDLQLGDAVRADNLAAITCFFPSRVSVDAGFDGFP